jgi:hypothetical protein
MPTSLRVLCVIFAALVVGHAILAPFVEQGADVVFPLAIDAGLIWLVWAFARRQHRPDTLSWLSIYCSVCIVIAPIFAIFALADPQSSYEQAQAALILAEGALCAVMFFKLRQDSTKAWFHANATS